MTKVMVGRTFNLVDAQGYVREVEVMIRRDTDIQVCVDIPYYVDSDGKRKKVIGDIYLPTPGPIQVDLSRYRYAKNDKPVVQKGEPRK